MSWPEAGDRALIGGAFADVVLSSARLQAVATTWDAEHPDGTVVTGLTLSVVRVMPMQGDRLVGTDTPDFQHTPEWHLYAPLGTDVRKHTVITSGPFCFEVATPETDQGYVHAILKVTR